MDIRVVLSPSGFCVCVWLVFFVDYFWQYWELNLRRHVCWANVLPLGYSHNTEVTYLLIIHIVFVRTKDTGKGKDKLRKNLQLC